MHTWGRMCTAVNGRHSYRATRAPRRSLNGKKIRKSAIAFSWRPGIFSSLIIRNSSRCSLPYWLSDSLEQCFSTSVPWHTGTRDIVRSTTRSGYFNQRLFHPVRLYLPPSTHPWKCRHGATAGERRMLSRCFAFSFNHAGPRLRSWFERIDLR